MYLSLLFVAALFSSHVVLATVPAIEKLDDLTVDNDRQERQFWPSDVPYSDSLYADPSLMPDGENEPQIRQNPWGLSNINSAVNPIAALWNQRPGAYIKNPNTPSFLRRYDSCDDPNGLKGVCVPSSLCSKYGGRPSGSCSIGLACCVNAVSKCGGLVTLNNTYWQSPPAISSDTTCGLTVALDNNLIEQKRPVCQIRLDFLSFTIAQPAGTSVCVTDTFVVGGAINKVPTICGENTGQHMYLNVPSSTVDVVMLFSFGKSATVRSWNIQISLLPCGSFYLAPSDCLQYFRENTGTIKSFNWRDVAPAAATRQLANQDYQICFRNQQIAAQANARICFTQCVVTAANGGNPFLLTGAAGGVSSFGNTNCRDDFLMIRDGFDSAIPANVADRYCGGFLNPINPGAATAVTVCTTVRDYQVYFKTDATEANGETANSGFCLDFTQSTTN